jgi:hypothetical protein
MLTKASARERIAIPARICKAHYWPANSRFKWIAEGIRRILIPLADIVLARGLHTQWPVRLSLRLPSILPRCR